MHVAFSKVHPVTHKVRTPFRDFQALSKVCRAMEQKYGLQVDKGMEAGERNRLSPKARDYESKTWQQSFESHLQEHKAEILETIGAATSWRQLHEGLAEFDTELKKRGAGMAFTQIGGKGALKASALDRSCSLAALEKRLGPFEPAPERNAKAAPRRPKRPYQSNPLTRHPATSRLWRTYRQEKPSTFLGRHVFNIRSWKDYLLADAHKDALALAIIVTYKELLHGIEAALTPRRAPYRAPKSLRPALQAWYAASPWKPPAIAGIGKADVDAMDLRTDGTGRVLFPFRDKDGHVWAVRALDGEGQTLDIGDPAGHPDLAHVIDPAGHLVAGKPYAGKIVLTSDCFAAAAIHAGTEAPAVIVGKATNLPTRARALKQAFPDSQVVVAATERSRPVSIAAQAVGAELVTINRQDVLTRWIAEQVGKGRAVPVEPNVAHTMGAFVEDALSADDARQSQPGKKPGKGPGKGDGGLGR